MNKNLFMFLLPGLVFSGTPPQLFRAARQHSTFLLISQSLGEIYSNKSVSNTVRFNVAW
ncbi:MAG: hypothetical protein ACRC6X_02350 [Culicoidibacterales bacterium]